MAASNSYRLLIPLKSTLSQQAVESCECAVTRHACSLLLIHCRWYKGLTYCWLWNQGNFMVKSYAIFSWRILNCMPVQSPSVSREQADTHHQQGKKNDPTAPDVCFPPVILLSLRTRECFLAGWGRVLGLVKIRWRTMKKKLVEQKQYYESVKNNLPWWLLDRRSVEICWENRKKCMNWGSNIKKEKNGVI